MQWTFLEILNDNYAWILYNEKKEAIVIDCGDDKAIITFLEKKDLNLKYILITHAHDDHIAGVKELKEATGALVVGSDVYQDRLPKLDKTVKDSHIYKFLDNKVAVFNTPGHCADHLVYYFVKDKLLFTGDLLFSLGCGRIFEGTPMDMVTSLSKLFNLPKETLVFPSHEYTKANLEFVKGLGFFDLEGKDSFIERNQITLPSTLEFEIKCNPFLNVDNEEFKNHVMGTKNIDNISFFIHLREMKNNKTKLIGG